MVTLPLAIGCSAAAPVYTDASATIDTAAGKQFNIVLDGNATTGYMWEASYDKAYLSLVKDEYKQNESKQGMVGVPGKHYFTFQALKAGKTEVTLNYKRAWEDSPIETKVFNINIK